MTPLQVALQIIALLETVEPTAQQAIMDLIATWKGNNDVKTILQGEVSQLNAIAAAARAQQGLPAIAASADPDPAPPIAVPPAS